MYAKLVYLVFVEPLVVGRPMGLAHASICSVDCVASGEALPVSVEDAFKATAILLAVKESSESRTSVVVPS